MKEKTHDVVEAQTASLVEPMDDQEPMAPSLRERITKYCEEKGLKWYDVPLVLGIHEAIGITYLGAAWGLCYGLQPTQALARVVPGDRIETALKSARGKLQQYSSVFDKVPFLRNVDRGRLVVSLAEQTLIRTGAKPVTGPLKIFMACYAVLWLKGGKQDGTVPN